MLLRYLLLLFVAGVLACNNSSGETSGFRSIADSGEVTDTTPPVEGPKSLSEAIDRAIDSSKNSGEITLNFKEMSDAEVFPDGSKPTTWENAGFNNSADVKLLIKKLKAWVAANKRDSVAANVNFPMRQPKVTSREAFLAGYDKIMTPKVRQQLAAQDLTRIMRNKNGAMIGSGQIWIAQTVRGPRIISINP